MTAIPVNASADAMVIRPMRRMVYRRMLVIGIVLVFFTNFALFFSTNVGTIIPLYWILLFAAGTIGFLLSAEPSSMIRITPLHIWIVSYLIISILWYLPFPEKSPPALEQLINRFLSATLLIVMLAIFADRTAQRVARRVIVVATLIGVAINLYELFNPGMFSTDAGRAAGLYGNSNQSAAALVLGMLLGIGVLPSKLRVPFSLLVGVGVFVTFSRSGVLGWLLIFVFSQLRAGRRLRGTLSLLSVAVLLGGFLASPLWTDLQDALVARGLITPDVEERLAFFGGNQVTDTSASTREEKAALAWSIFKEHPLVGLGTGASREGPFEEVGPHNIYLALMVDHGFLGALIMVALLVAISWGAQNEAKFVAIQAVVFTLFWGLFSHNILEEPYFLISFALVTSMTASSRGLPSAAGAHMRLRAA